MLHLHQKRSAKAHQLIGATLLSLVLFGCYEPRSKGDSVQDSEERCSTCHGDPARAGNFLRRSAPPNDLSGRDDISYPGVGAHTIHLNEGATHGSVACVECHVVPTSADAPGHADDEGPAEVSFGPLARTGELVPAYDSVARRCSSTYCHGGEEPLWTKPRTSEDACGSCHGLPPEAPHPASTDCVRCHEEVIDQRGFFVRPELHVDGRIQVKTPACQSCHGDQASAAPPKDTTGNSDVSFVGVGAHRAHLLGSGQSRPLACGECHQVPSGDAVASHVNGGPALVLFSGVGVAHGSLPTWDRESLTCSDAYCHSPSLESSTVSPLWTSTDSLDCGSCHKSPPSAPHPQMDDCSVCHGEVLGSDGEFIAPERHVDGVVDVEVPTACNACHGSENAAPPVSVAGSTSSQSPGVGAHQIHVVGRGSARPLPCTTCHLPVEDVLGGGHLDSSLPAEVVFSEVAVAFSADPAYVDGACANTYCHGAVFPEGRDSGGTLTTPNWTAPSGTESDCGSCHGLPPPLGHPQFEDCASCHQNVRSDNVSFFDPLLHVNGVVETYLE